MKRIKKIHNKSSLNHNRNGKNYGNENCVTNDICDLRRNPKEKVLKPTTFFSSEIKNNDEITKKNKKLQDHYAKILNPVVINIKNTFINKQYNNVQPQKYTIQQTILVQQDNPISVQIITPKHNKNKKSSFQILLTESFDHNHLIDYKQKYYSILKQLGLKQSNNNKTLEKSKTRKQKNKLTDNKYYDQTSQTKTSVQNDDIVVTSYVTCEDFNGGVLKCNYHNTNQAKYLLELNNDEDLLCCEECGNMLKVEGYQLEQISHLKSKRTYDIDNFLQKSLQSINNLKRYLQHLHDHYKITYNQLKVQIETHDNYYDTLIQLINKKRQETKSILTKSLDKISEYFDKTQHLLQNQYLQIEANYKHMILNRENMNKISQNDFQNILKLYMDKLYIDETHLKSKLELWKVEVGDFEEFEKQFEKFVVKFDEDTKFKSILEEESVCQLFCQQQFDSRGGANLHLKNLLLNESMMNEKNKDMYYSFQKKNNKFDLQNFQKLQNLQNDENQNTYSPAFKQI